ncbi:predicted protein [Naegleria gruberi]|uniref:Predicted protein n=1 Tax=Naegleria gruberi TaxID=5762 RepID=D2VJY6_NAEGR|nr:uncharacterized protein NAEGRDRAFT_50170 [Naegleria gruberi]EFC42772.1 predicted protein [Naegleria gruberi]|eukprot:XP_002675516.1 predicted protein [Naegleria gruberi strain NEG-M]
MRHSRPPVYNHFHHSSNNNGGLGRDDFLMNSKDKFNVDLKSSLNDLQITNSLRKSMNRRESMEDLTVFLEKNQNSGLLPIQPTPPPLNREDSLANDVFTYQDSMKEFSLEELKHHHLRRLNESRNESYRASNYFESAASLITTTTEEQNYYDEDDENIAIEGVDRESDIMLHSDDEDYQDEDDFEGQNHLLGKKKVKVFPFLVDSPPDLKKKGRTKALQVAYNKRKEKLQRVKQELEMGRTSPTLFSINSQTPPPFRKSPCPPLDIFHQNSFHKKKPDPLLSSIESLLVQIPHQSSSATSISQQNHHNLSTFVPSKERPSSMKAGHRKKNLTSSADGTKTSRSVSSTNVNLNCLQKDPIPDDYLGHHIATTSSRIQSKYKEHFAVSKNPIVVIANRNQYKEKKADKEKALQNNSSSSSSLPLPISNSQPSQSLAPPHKSNNTTTTSTVKEPMNRAPLYKIPQAPKRKKLTPEDLGLTYQASLELDKGLPTSCQVDAKKVIMQTLINSWIGIGPSLGDVNVENRKPLNLKPSKITSSNPEERRKEILKLMYKDRQTEVKENILKPKQTKKNR